jgi:putative ABC transport system permease protein
VGLGRFFRRRHWDEERARELEAHIELETDDNLARGMAPDEARFAARRKLGNVTRIREEIHLMNSAGFLDTLWQDVRYGLRQLAGDRGFTTVAVLTLGLGIGSVTVMYSVLHNVLLDPFPYARSGRMVDVVVRDMDRPEGFHRGELFPDEFLDFQEQSRSFEAVIGTATEGMVLRQPERSEPVSIAWSTPNVFEFLGVEPLVGRTFGSADALAGAAPVAVLSHAAWQRHFGCDVSVIGRGIVLNDSLYTVVGVMPPRFTWHVADAWVPKSIERGASADTPSARRWFQAHLRPGVSVAQAAAELTVIAEGRAREHPADYPKRLGIAVITVIDWVVGRFRGVLYTLFGAVSLLLVIACVNVANMLLARASAREREVTIRAALGASRGRIVRQLLVESAILALAGGAAGCLIAWGLLRALLEVLPRQGIAYEVEIALDRPVLAFSLAVSLLASLLFGLLPALHSARRDLVGSLKQGGRGIASGFRRGGLRAGLVVGEVALSLVLLLSAGLLMRSFLRMARVDLGIDASHVVRFAVVFASNDPRSSSERQQLLGQVVDRIRALPGVVATAEASGLPLGGFSSELEVPGRPSSEPRTGRFQLCGQGFLRTFGVSLLRGRDFTGHDVAGARRVAIVNQALVAAHFGGEDPLGQTIRVKRLETIPEPVVSPVFEIVGVMRDTRNAGLGRGAEPAVFIPATTTAWGSRLVAVRTAADPRAMLEPLRRAAWSVEPGLALTQAEVLESVLRERYYSQPRFSLIVLGTFAAVGLLLVGVGVYGVMAYTVARQRQEIAVRMALGAGRGDIHAMVLRTGARLLAAGVAAGLLLGTAASRLVASQLWNTSPHDPATLLLAVVVVVSIGCLACYVPAARAVRVDPIAALRLD